MRPVAFGEPLPGGTQLTLLSDDKPDRFFRVIKSWIDETSEIALALKPGVPSYQVKDEEGRIHLLLRLPIEEGIEDRCAFGGPITQDSIPGRFLMTRWCKNRKAGVMAAPATLRVARARIAARSAAGWGCGREQWSNGVLDYCVFGELRVVAVWIQFSP